MLTGLIRDHVFGYIGGERICLDVSWEKERLSPAFAEDPAEDETDIGRPFAETSHEIRKPLPPERHVYPHPVALAGQGGLQVAPDAVQHLKLVLVDRALALRRVRAGGVEHVLIVSG